MSPEFNQTMARLAAEHRAARAPARVERAVLAEFDAARRRRVWRRIAVCGAVAAGLAATALLVRERPAPQRVILASAAPAPLPHDPVPVIAIPARAPKPVVARASHRRAVTPLLPAVAPEQPEPFVAIPYTVPLAPGERTTVLRMMLSAPAMAAIGVPLPAIDPGGETPADVLVGEDGRARAIRLVANSGFHQ